MDNKFLTIILAVVVVAAGGVTAGVLLLDGNGSSSERETYVDAESGLTLYKDTGKIAEKKCDPYTFTDGDGNTYTYDHTFGAIAINASSYGGALMTLMALCGDDFDKYIVGFDKTELKKTIFSWWFDDLPVLETIDDCSYESATTILATHPAAYVSITGAYTTNDAAQAVREAGIPIFALNYQSEDPVKIANGIDMLGKMFGLEERAKEIADYYVNMTKPFYDKADTLIAANGGERPVVYAEFSGMDLTTMSSTYNNEVQWGAIIYKCGGTVLAPEDGDTSVKWPTYTSAYVLSKADEIDGMMASCNGNGTIKVGYNATVESILTQCETVFSQTEGARAGWGDIKAWQDGNFAAVGHALGRNLCDFPCIISIAKLVWPEEYADMDPQEELEKFWEEYMPEDLSLEGIWFVNYGDETASP